MKSNSTGFSNSEVFTIVKGKFTQRVPEDTPGAKARVLEMGKNAGQTIHEIGWSELEGHITGGRLEQTDFGWVARVCMEDFESGESYEISMGTDSKFLETLTQRLPLLNVDQRVKLNLGISKKKTASGGNIYNLYISQAGISIQSHYLKWAKDAQGKAFATPMNGMPEPEEGPTGRDYSNQNKFLLKAFKEYFEEFTPPHKPSYEDEEPPVNNAQEQPIEEDDDDVPF